MAYREYTTKDKRLTVIWQSELCVHCGLCRAGLPEVFRPEGERPWVQVDAATPGQVEAQVHQCPSGALTIRVNDDE